MNQYKVQVMHRATGRIDNRIVDALTDQDAIRAAVSHDEVVASIRMLREAPGDSQIQESSETINGWLNKSLSEYGKEQKKQDSRYDAGASGTDIPAWDPVGVAFMAFGLFGVIVMTISAIDKGYSAKYFFTMACLFVVIGSAMARMHLRKAEAKKVFDRELDRRELELTRREREMAILERERNLSAREQEVRSK